MHRTNLQTSELECLACVLKMLQEHHLTSAPRAVNVSMSTAVWMVMWSEPAILAPLKGCEEPNSVLRGHQDPLQMVKRRGTWTH